MRTPSAVFRWLSAGILVTILLFCLLMPVFADTGTYEIQKYEVTLEPLDDGRVGLTIEQTWKVLSGNIPWITVGLPNDNFDIESHDLAVKNISKSSSGGFSGVKIDLDKTYLPGEIFIIRFKVLQSNLLEILNLDKIWRINYTPGWYDRARIGDLSVKVISPVRLESYSSVKPTPVSKTEGMITWQKHGLSPGERLNIELVSTDGSFLSVDASANGSSTRSFGDWIVSYLQYLPMLIFFAVVGLVIWYYLKKRVNRKKREKARTYNDIMKLEAEMEQDPTKKREIEKGFREYVKEKNLQPDSEGNYYDKKNGRITPSVWAMTISERHRHMYRHYQPYVRPHFHGGTRPYRPSCVACACVSCACACACACAGGGAAGCSRKTLHECPACTESINNTAQSDFDDNM